MRRLLYLLAAALVLPLLGSAALAAPQAELVRAFVYDRTLTAYVDLSGTDQPVTKAEAKIDGQTFPASQAMETVRQAGAPVTYLLLVDCSTSMPAYAGEVVAFAQALAEGAGENTRFILATFGEDFAVAAEELTAETLPQAVGGLAYEARSTRLQSGIQGALDYLEAIPRQGGELRSMVVLTDAVEYDPNGVESYEETLQRLENSDVMVHALGVGSDAASLESLFTLVEASGGSRFQAADETEADQAARTLTEETGRLYVTGFDLGSYQTEGGETAVAVTFASNGTLLCRAERNVDFPALEGEAPVEETPSQELPDSTPQQSSGGGTAPAPAEEETGAPWVWIAAGGGAALLAVLLLLWIASRRKRRRAVPAPVSPAPAQPEEEGIFLRLETPEGQPASGRTEFFLTEQLTVGRDPGCDILFDSQALSRQHARVFTANGAVYLEDLGSQNGTAVNGEPLQMAVRLRSGDEITAGDVRFRLKF